MKNIKNTMAKRKYHSIWGSSDNEEQPVEPTKPFSTQMKLGPQEDTPENRENLQAFLEALQREDTPNEPKN